MSRSCADQMACVLRLHGSKLTFCSCLWGVQLVLQLSSVQQGRGALGFEDNETRSGGTEAACVWILWASGLFCSAVFGYSKLQMTSHMTVTQRFSAMGAGSTCSSLQTYNTIFTVQQ